jgi:hypothetical protein
MARLDLRLCVTILAGFGLLLAAGCGVPRTSPLHDASSAGGGVVRGADNSTLANPKPDAPPARTAESPAAERNAISLREPPMRYREPAIHLRR